MSKKQTKDQEAGEGPLQVPYSEDVEQPAAAAPSHWTETMWGTHVRWACAYCPFDSLDGEAAMAEHYLTEHAPPAAPTPAATIQVYDRWGNPV